MSAGRLDPERPKVPDLVPLIQAVYRRHAAGCCLHVVTDDRNLERSNVEFVLDWARRAGHPDCVAAAEMMQRMTRSQIGRAGRLRDGDHT